MTNQVPTPSYGAEIEKVFSSTDGRPHVVGNAYFEHLGKAKKARGEKTKLKYIKDVAVGVYTPYGEESLDNSFALGESATGPVSEKDGGLVKLHKITTQELQDVQAALAAEGGTILNMSNHPLITVNKATYQRTVAPKPVYDYLNNVRGWKHMAGIDAKAQNSPSTGVPPSAAVRAVNVMIGLGAPLIAIYANSPFEGGKLTGKQENRMNIWPEMFGKAHAKWDRRMHLPPLAPFKNMRDYFQWMFPADSTMFFVLAGSNTTTVKGDTSMVIIDGKPSLLEFMRGEKWQGTIHGSSEKTTVIPEMHHFALHQFTQFSGARIRYGFKDQPLDVKKFNEAMSKKGYEVDALFEEYCAFTYIEGRDPGANFADASLVSLPNKAIAKSVVISPAAIQAGMLRNLEAAEALMHSYPWETLCGLRQQAAIDGLEASYDGTQLRPIADALLSIARDGLKAEEHWMLAYPKHVLHSGENGAVKAMKLYEQTAGSDYDRLQAVARGRAAIIPE